MGIRLTGVSTPIGGVSWEYTKPTSTDASPRIIPGQKIKVFISSKCGDPKYDKVREELKNAIEDTSLADVYLFEKESASTLPAGNHYIWALEESDLCIFLIDNADGIPNGVQAEIDTVNKHNIKAIYYFCDEKQTEKTPLEQSLMGAKFAKSKTVHSFSELSSDGAKAFIDDVIAVYHYYCNGKFAVQNNDKNEVQSLDVIGTERYKIPTIPKLTLNNINKCTNRLYEFAFGYSPYFQSSASTNENFLDDWGLIFLDILLGDSTIQSFNTEMYLEILNKQQGDEYNTIVALRWKAIQSYFSGNIKKSIEYFEKSLKRAKETEQSSWIINDILIDLRNLHNEESIENNELKPSEAQIELDNSYEEIHYPIIDRINESLQEEYIKGLYKKQIESPFTVNIGNNHYQLCKMIADIYIVAMYNGSLTHILLTYEKIKELLFYISCKQDDWKIKKQMYKMVLFLGDSKEIKEFQEAYPEIKNKINADEALNLLNFCNRHPILYKKTNSFLLTFGAVGYYIDDKNYPIYEQKAIQFIKTWIYDDSGVVSLGTSIIKCLPCIAHRLSPNVLSEICCCFFKRHYSRWYLDIFKLIAQYIDINEMDLESSTNLIEHINQILDDEEERKQIAYSLDCLCILRKQSPELTEVMDKKISEYFPKYYNGNYKLESTQNEAQDMPLFIQKYIEDIERSNTEQGKNGHYYAHGVNRIATIRAILTSCDLQLENIMMDRLISVISDTLLISKEGVDTKLDAISLLIYIAVKYPSDYQRNKEIYEKLFDQKESLNIELPTICFNNIDSISLRIGLLFLYVVMKRDVFSDLLEIMPYIQNDTATIIAVTRFIADYLAISDTVLLPNDIESIVLQNVLRWLVIENTTIRFYAIRILLTMARNPKNHGVINSQLISLMDNNGPAIKNYILRNIKIINGISNDTKNYIISKCQNDPNYIVRKVCREVSASEEEKN